MTHPDDDINYDHENKAADERSDAINHALAFGDPATQTDAAEALRLDDIRRRLEEWEEGAISDEEFVLEEYPGATFYGVHKLGWHLKLSAKLVLNGFTISGMWQNAARTIAADLREELR